MLHRNQTLLQIPELSGWGSEVLGLSISSSQLAERPGHLTAEPQSPQLQREDRRRPHSRTESGHATRFSPTDSPHVSFLHTAELETRAPSEAQWAHGRELNTGRSDFSPQQSPLRWDWQTIHGVSCCGNEEGAKHLKRLPIY